MSDADVKNSAATVDRTSDRAIPERARELAGDVGREVLERANAQGQRGMRAMGESLERAANYVGANVGAAVADAEVPGVRREHVDAVADGLHSASRYLREKDPSSLVSDVDGAIRRHPYRAMAIGLGVGYLVGRWMRSDR